MNFWLPPELIAHVISFVGDPVVCRFVCRLWRDLLRVRVYRRYPVWLALTGQLNKLKWAWQQGCPMSQAVCAAAMEKEYEDMLLFLYLVGAPLTPKTVEERKRCWNESGELDEYWDGPDCLGESSSTYVRSLIALKFAECVCHVALRHDNVKIYAWARNYCDCENNQLAEDSKKPYGNLRGPEDVNHMYAKDFKDAVHFRSYGVIRLLGHEYASKKWDGIPCGEDREDCSMKWTFLRSKSIHSFVIDTAFNSDDKNVVMALVKAKFPIRPTDWEPAVWRGWLSVLQCAHRNEYQLGDTVAEYGLNNVHNDISGRAHNVLEWMISENLISGPLCEKITKLLGMSSLSAGEVRKFCGDTMSARTPTLLNYG